MQGSFTNCYQKFMHSSQFEGNQSITYTNQSEMIIPDNGAPTNLRKHTATTTGLQCNDFILVDFKVQRI